MYLCFPRFPHLNLQPRENKRSYQQLKQFVFLFEYSRVSMVFPFIHILPATRTASAGKELSWKPDIISAGRKRQSILQIDSFRRLRSCNILASPMYSSAERATQSRKAIPRRRPWIYGAEASATEQGLFPSGLQATAAPGDLWRGWHSWLFLVTEENWTWTGFGEV